MKKLAFIFLLILASAEVAQCQNFYKDMVTPKNQVQVSSGPSFIYANTSGRIRTLGFKILPSMALAYSHQINPHLTLRGTTGVQWLQSNLKMSQEVKERWGQQSKAYGFQGQAFYADFMPMLQLFPARHQGATVNAYAGAGLGWLHVNSSQFSIINQGMVEKKANINTAYVPIRAAIGKKLNDSIELLMEGTFMATFSDQLDGNNGKKRVRNDHLLQGHVALKKFF